MAPARRGTFASQNKTVATPRTIAILGAGSKNGTTAAKKLAANNRLLLVDQDRESLEKLKAEVQSQHNGQEVEIMECFQDTGWEADAIVLAIQSTKDNEIFTLMKPYVTGKIVIVFSCGKEDNLNALLPHSKVVRINEADCECVNKMETILSEAI
jgi:ketopantoate reductase